MGHPNLSDEINANLLRLDLNGGLDLETVAVGATIKVQTKNTLYTLVKQADGRYFISGNAQFCPTPVLCSVHGSTWGGSMLKTEFIGIGMHMEFSIGSPVIDGHPGEHLIITTSQIQSANVS